MLRSFVFASIATAILVAAGCSSSSSGTTGATDAGSGTDTGVGGGDGGAGGAPTCAAYCTSIMSACTADHQQFTSADQCLASCKAYPVGTAADTSGNTLGCRAHAATAAASDATQCTAAGPGGAGKCGNDCDGFCQIAMMYCTAANSAAVYPDLATCKTTCAMFPDTATFNVTDTTLQTEKQVACLLYHVQEGSVDPPDHCLGDLAPDDAGNASTTCSM